MTEEAKKEASQTVKTAIKVILGIAFLSVGIWLIWLWRWEIWTIIKGFLGIMTLLAGVIFLAIAKE